MLPTTVTPRTFAAILGGLVALAGLILLVMPVSATNTGAAFLSTYEMDCGNAITANASNYGGQFRSACEDALATRRLWAWPLLVVGGVVLTGALVIQTPTRQPHREPEPEG